VMFIANNETDRFPAQIGGINGSRFQVPGSSFSGSAERGMVIL